MCLADDKHPAHDVLTESEIARCKMLLVADPHALAAAEPTIVLKARPWIAAMRDQWGDKLSRQELLPCLWLRWANTQRGLANTLETMRVFGLWHTGLLLKGEMAVVKSKGPGRLKSTDASLKKYGPIEGHGTPAHLFVLEPYSPELEKRLWRIKIYDLPRDALPLPKPASGKSARRSAAAAALQGRGRGVIQAVDSAINALCQKGDAVSRLPMPAPNGARFQTPLNRDDLLVLIGKDKLVKKYAETTVRAVLSGIVVAQRGRPTRS